MGKENIVKIKDGRYRYEYDDASGKTIYKGPVGTSPPLTEQQFRAAMVTTEEFERRMKSAFRRNMPPSNYIEILSDIGLEDRQIEDLFSGRIEYHDADGKWFTKDTGITFQLGVERKSGKIGYAPALWQPIQVKIHRKWPSVPTDVDHLEMEGRTGSEEGGTIKYYHSASHPRWRVTFPEGIEVFLYTVEQMAGM